LSNLGPVGAACGGAGPSWPLFIACVWGWVMQAAMWPVDGGASCDVNRGVCVCGATRAANGGKWPSRDFVGRDWVATRRVWYVCVWGGGVGGGGAPSRVCGGSLCSE
jgi:hypothetical protein